MGIALSDDVKALVRGANFAHLATLMTDGSPLAVAALCRTSPAIGLASLALSVPMWAATITSKETAAATRSTAAWVRTISLEAVPAYTTCPAPP